MSNKVPEGWFIETIANISSKVGSGITPTGGSKVYSSSGVKFIRSQNVHFSGLSLNDLAYISPDIHSSMSGSKLKDGDVLLNITGASIGRCSFVPEDFGEANVNQHVCIIRPNEKVSTQFLAQWLASDFGQHAIAIYQAGGNREGLNFQQIRSISLNRPPLPEQKKIAAILSSVDEAIEKTRAQIDKLKDLKTGMMQELLTKGIGPGGVPHTEFKDSPVGRIPVGWESYLLGDVFDLKNGVNKDKDAFGHGVPIISYKNVYVGGGILDSDLSALVEMNEKELSRFRVHFGDVFFTRTSETPDEIGFSNVYLGRRDDVVFNGFVIRARQKNGLFHPNFLKHVFQSNAVRKQMMDNSKFTTRAGISGESLGRIAIAVPDISEQKNIANALDSVEARITKTINKINAIQSFKKALMQDLLTGKVRVNVDARELADA